MFLKEIVEQQPETTRKPDPGSLARSLRVNYQQLGEAKSANKAIHIELQATKTHLYKAWHSQETYYREKYAGWARGFDIFLESDELYDHLLSITRWHRRLKIL